MQRWICCSGAEVIPGVCLGEQLSRLCIAAVVVVLTRWFPSHTSSRGSLLFITGCMCVRVFIRYTVCVQYMCGIPRAHLHHSCHFNCSKSMKTKQDKNRDIFILFLTKTRCCKLFFAGISDYEHLVHHLFK